MRIRVRSKDSNFRLWLPNRLLLNPVSAAICVRALKGKKYAKLKAASSTLIETRANKGIVTYSATLKLFKAIRKSRHILKGQPLVMVHGSDGDVVEIWL